MTEANKDIKHFNMRMPKDLWLFLKNQSAKKGTPMTFMISDLVEKYKNRIEKRLDKDK